MLGSVVSTSAQVSPEVHPDRTVTFRVVAPGASKVTVSLEGSGPLPLTKSADNLWEATTAPLVPDIYGYTFSVDGQATLDTRNPLFKPNLIWQSNMVVVPGSPAQPWEVQDVPHGTVHHHYYRSGIIGDQRDYFVYTPAGYSTSSRAKLPVLYLLHGYSDIASGWTEVGKANVILDNLIAQGKTKPMVVVMTLGYGVPDFASPTSRNFSDRSLVERNLTNYRKALLEEVVPTVEKEYRVSSKREDRAIAGLSMGGSESLFVGLNNLPKFSYVGAFSTGGLSSQFDQVFPGFTAETANKELKLLWISCGTEDGLITFNRGLVGWLKGKGTNLEAVETSGQHTWMVWRRNLIAFSQKLFR